MATIQCHTVLSGSSKVQNFIWSFNVGHGWLSSRVNCIVHVHCSSSPTIGDMAGAVWIDKFLNYSYAHVHVYSFKHTCTCTFYDNVHFM